MKNLIKTFGIAALLFSFLTGCNNLEEENARLKHRLSVANQKADSLQNEIETFPKRLEDAKNAAIYEIKEKEAEEYANTHFSASALRLDSNDFKIAGLHPENFWSRGLQGLNQEEYFAYIPGYLQNYVRISDNAEWNDFVDRMNNPWVLNMTFQALKPKIKFILETSGLKEKAKTLAAQMKPYCDGSANPKTVAAFQAYYNLHANDTIFGEPAFEQENKEWKAIEVLYGGDTDIATNQFKNWLFIDRHSKAALKIGLEREKIKVPDNDKRWRKIMSDICMAILAT